MADHLPSSDLDFLTQWLHLSSLKQGLSPDVILPSDMVNSVQAIHSLICLHLCSFSIYLYSKAGNAKVLYSLSLVLLEMLFEFQVLLSLTYAPLAFESLFCTSFIPPPSLLTFTPRYVN